MTFRPDNYHIWNMPDLLPTGDRNENIFNPSNLSGHPTNQGAIGMGVQIREVSLCIPIWQS